jgi:hypothetical protein
MLSSDGNANGRIEPTVTGWNRAKLGPWEQQNEGKGQKAMSRDAACSGSKEQRSGDVNSRGYKHKEHCKNLFCEPGKSQEGDHDMELSARNGTTGCSCSETKGIKAIIESNIMESVLQSAAIRAGSRYRKDLRFEGDVRLQSSGSEFSDSHTE